MKTQALIVAMALALFAGCASENQDSVPSDVTRTSCTGTSCETVIDANGDGIPDAPTGTGTDPGTTGYATGSTASVTLNGSALGRMFYNSQPVHPTNVRINIDVTSNTEAVIISYVENGVLHEAAFGTQHPNNSSVSNAMYNGWVYQNGTNVWKGFFQDAYGAIVLVLDKSIAQNDGTATTILGGSVYFQNFQESAYQNPVQGPLKMCWEITAGPYDCRTFISGNSVNVLSSLYPNNRGPDKSTNYEKLGDFGGISRVSAGL
jgi:hypothetical protein